MPDQRDVQQLIQSLTPSAVNNGNPNTVYNQPMPQGGYIPPTFDPGTNTWRVNPAPAPSTVNWQQMSASQPQSWGWQTPAQPAPPVLPNGPLPTTPTTPTPTTPVPTPTSPLPPGYTGNDSPIAGGGREFSGCVAIDQEIYGFASPEDVNVGDVMPTVDVNSYKMTEHEVTYAETKVQPCLIITTDSGASLKCSTSAPLLKEGDVEAKAEALMVGDKIAVQVEGLFDYSEIVSIEDVGYFSVRHITCGNQYFLAGSGNDKYILHHNVKRNSQEFQDLYSLREGLVGMAENGFVGGGGVQEGSNTRGAMQDNGSWDLRSGGTASNPATAWGEAQAGYMPTGQGLTDAFGVPTSGVTNESGYMTDAWEGLGNPNIDTWDTSWMQPTAAGSNIPTMSPVQATPSGGGMYDYQNTAPEANDTGGFLDKAVNWFDNTVLNNFYDETTNSWNKGNIGWSVLSALTGMPLEDQVQRTSLNNLFTDGGMGSDYARTQTQQAYDRSDAAKREAMVTNLAQKYDKAPQEVLQIIGRMP